jgi:6-methylsalicylate decarboxylase
MMFAAGLETYPGLDADAARAAVERTDALALFPRLGIAPPLDAGSPVDQARHAVSRGVMRAFVRLINTR